LFGLAQPDIGVNSFYQGWLLIAQSKTFFYTIYMQITWPSWTK